MFAVAREMCACVILRPTNKKTFVSFDHCLLCARALQGGSRAALEQAREGSHHGSCGRCCSVCASRGQATAPAGVASTTVRSGCGLTRSAISQSPGATVFAVVVLGRTVGFTGSTTDAFRRQRWSAVPCSGVTGIQWRAQGASCQLPAWLATFAETMAAAHSGTSERGTANEKNRAATVTQEVQ